MACLLGGKIAPVFSVGCRFFCYMLFLYNYSTTLAADKIYKYDSPNCTSLIEAAKMHFTAARSGRCSFSAIFSASGRSKVYLTLYFLYNRS